MPLEVNEVHTTLRICDVETSRRLVPVIGLDSWHDVFDFMLYILQASVVVITNHEYKYRGRDC